MPTSTVTLASPEDVVGVIPAMLGFHPEQSVVLVGLEGARRRSCLTLRADLPSPDVDAGDLALQLADRVARGGADTVIAVVMTDESPAADGALPYQAFALGLQDALVAAAVDPLDVLLVRADRVWSYACADAHCCPPEGRPLPDTPTDAAARFRAEVVGRGGVVWPTRAGLVASIAAPDEARTVELEPVFAQVSAQILEATADRGIEEVRAETVGLFTAIHARYAAASDRLTDREAARLSVGLADVLARDDVLMWGAGVEPGPYLALLGDLVRSSLPPVDGPACVVLAWASYQAGDGALAQCALDRAMRSDPDSGLAQLLAHAIEMALPPQRLTAVSALATLPPCP
jgi:hypothetical protein